MSQHHVAAPRPPDRRSAARPPVTLLPQIPPGAVPALWWAVWLVTLPSRLVLLVFVGGWRATTATTRAGARGVAGLGRRAAGLGRRLPRARSDRGLEPLARLSATAAVALTVVAVVAAVGLHADAGLGPGPDVAVAEPPTSVVVDDDGRPQTLADVRADGSRPAIDPHLVDNELERRREPAGPSASRTRPAVAAMDAAAASRSERQVALPVGKGMWLWQFDRVEGGDVAAMVARADGVGLTHLYVRTGSSRQGFYAGDTLDAILPAAHEAGLRVYGWDFPYLEDVGADVNRAHAAIHHRTPGGHAIDGFVADVETPAEGTSLTPEKAAHYGAALRAVTPRDVALVVAVPRPSESMQRRYPYGAVVEHFDAISPMTYWLNRQPDTDADHDVRWLSRFGKPVIPIGQAYDGAPEGGRPGTPPRDEILRFLDAAERAGAVGASFWSWQHASQEVWDAIGDAGEFTIPPHHDALLEPQLRAVQTALRGFGFATAADGLWSATSAAAMAVFQGDAGLPTTGRLDPATRAALLGPVGR